MKIKSILITGGTGSFGKAFIKKILETYPDIERLVIYSRDELKQFEMAQFYTVDKFPQIRFFLGDMRDLSRLKLALEGIDIVIHAAALKQVVAAEYNPFEFIKTNIIGAQNLIEASLLSDVKKVVALSTDKAAAPINLYGATKLCSDKLFSSANNLTGANDITFSIVRYGNVIGSRGSVIPFFLNKRSSGIIPITHKDMTRFNISLDDGVNMVMWTLNNSDGGEIFVPKIPSYRILDVAEAIAPNCKQEIVGIRPGEKLHEEMITLSDGPNTVDLGKYYAILPSYKIDHRQEYIKKHGGKLLPDNFSYNSGTNSKFLTVEEIRELVKTHVDPSFSI